MTLKKTTKSKRTNLPRDSGRSKQFIKDWEDLSCSGRYDMNELKVVMMLLIENSVPLPAEYSDHSLNGKWKGHRECHIGGDFLLIYKLNGSGAKEEIVFVRTGTHSELFG